MNSVFIIRIFVIYTSRAHGNFLIGQNILACTLNHSISVILWRDIRTYISKNVMSVIYVLCL